MEEHAETASFGQEEPGGEESDHRANEAESSGEARADGSGADDSYADDDRHRAEGAENASSAGEEEDDDSEVPDHRENEENGRSEEEPSEETDEDASDDSSDAEDREFRTRSVQLIERVENDDPTVVAVDVDGDIWFAHETRFLQALQTNTHVEALRIHDRASIEMEVEQVALLLQFLRNSPSLKKFECWHWSDTVVVRRALHALSHNRNLQELVLGGVVTIPEDSLAELLHESKSLKRLDTHWSALTSSTGPVAGALSSGFASNNSLEFLDLSYLKDASLVPLLNAAASSTSLRGLKLASLRDCSLEVATALGCMLSSSPVRILQIHYSRWTHETFQLITRGLQGSSVTKVEFRGCSFDEGSTRLFQEMFVGNIRTLELDTFSVKFAFSLGMVLAGIVGKSRCSLKELELSGLPGNVDFPIFLDALQGRHCQLESLMFTGGMEREIWQALIDRLPRFRSLNTLGLRITTSVHYPSFLRIFPMNLGYPSIRDSFIQAAHANISLETIRICSVPIGGEAPETLHDDFDSIVTRNRGLKRFRDDPTEHPLALWNSIFERALECDLGHDLIYSCLRGQVESQWWNQASNKRRRTAPEG